ncbi:carbohydrate-binding protein [Paenibacillus urinalis]|uniref:Carbohydrate-binding protein n=1 Tax=Paenibacillus urinalis TaxID=521520 RepID=A0AAX3N527_9BACL|nr:MULTISPECIES: carbohydrate-binding protein [Paenibacillus]WDH84851.1 carbohydrate-binding protein [Paenibacillus urinalis]WDI00026.1 carbohydrate-binding protein [Paenibacillus urinalis]WDI04534.1 carbohydrate-binding protein [Paenibacillus urinalis]
MILRVNIKKSVLILLAFLTALPLIVTPTQVTAASDANINLSSEKQLIKGFGGINHPAWIGDLTPAQRETAFGNGANQLGFSILRIYVDENRNNWYREVPTAQKAIEQGAIVFASPWNPPSDMVETFNRNGDPNAKRLRYDKYAAYAQHLNDFVTYMKNNGVDLYAISVQNEPDYAHEWTWWTPQEILRFMKENAGSIQGTKVMAPESFQYLKNMSDPILNDPGALANMDILGAHTYGTQIKDFAYPLFKQKGAGKELWMTEVYYPNSDNNSSDRWPEALEVSYHMHNAMVEGDFQAYVWWYIRRQYGPMNENGTISKRGYNMAHFSKFVRPGYIRVDATKNPDTNTFVSAYKGDNKVVIVAINRGTSAASQKFVLQNGNASTVSSWVTDSSRNMASGAPITVSSGAFTAQLPAQSVTTFVANITGGGGSPVTGTTYEAETGTTLTNAAIESLYPGYTGSGYVNFNAYTDSAIQWNAINNTITGTKNIKFRYALESGTRNLDIFVNGTKVISNEPFPATGSWSTWSEKSIQVPMNAGTNTLKIVTTGTEGPNVDNITVTAVQ